MSDATYQHGQRQERDEKIPRLLLRAIGALILFSLVAVIVGRATDTGLSLAPAAEPVETRILAFDDRPDGITVVRDHETGAEVALLDRGENGFIFGVLRGLARERALARMDEGEVFILTRWDDGRLSIEDPVTKQKFDLNSFGRDNLMAFARLLKSWEDQQ